MSGDKETPEDAVKNEAEDLQEQAAETDAAEAESELLSEAEATETSEPEGEEGESAETDPDLSEEDAQDAEEAVEPAEETTESASQENAAELSAPAPQPVPQVVKRGGFVPMLLGGAVCLALGYVGAQFVKPSGWPFPGTNTEELSTQIVALQNELAALKSATTETAASQKSATAALRSDLEGQIAALDPASELTDLQGRIAGFEDRMTEMEARPVASAIVSPEATAAYERQLAQMQDLLNSEIARLETAKEQAVADETAARIATNKARLQAQVDGGEPFATVLSEIGADAPAALSAAASEGIPSVSALEAGYAEAARAALVAASRAAYDAGEQGWFQTALRTQLGLRSTTPKQGDGPDAVLSRAEQFVRDGLFAKAIAVLDTLPEAGKVEMQGWIAQAQKRVDVMTALDEFLGQ